MGLVGLCDIALILFQSNTPPIHGNHERALRVILSFLDYEDLIRLTRTNSVFKVAVRHYAYESLAIQWNLIYNHMLPQTVWGIEFDLLRAQAANLYTLEFELTLAKQFTGNELQSAGEICEYLRDQKTHNDPAIYQMMTILVRKALYGILKDELLDEEKTAFKQLLVLVKDQYPPPTIIPYFSQFVHSLPRIYKDISKSQKDALHVRSLLLHSIEAVHTQLKFIYAKTNKPPYHEDLQHIARTINQTPYLKLTPEETKTLANRRTTNKAQQPQYYNTTPAITTKLPLPSLVKTSFDSPHQAQQHLDGSYSFRPRKLNHPN